MEKEKKDYITKDDKEFDLESNDIDLEIFINLLSEYYKNSHIEDDLYLNDITDYIDKNIKIDDNDKNITYEKNEEIQFGQLSENIQKASDFSELGSIPENLLNKALIYEESKYYTIDVSKKDLSELRKNFIINRDGQCGTSSSGFEISGDKTQISGKGKIWKTVLSVLNENRGFGYIYN